MGLFDKVRQVLARAGRGRSDDDRPVADPQDLPSPGTAQPAQTLQAAQPVEPVQPAGAAPSEPEPSAAEPSAAEPDDGATAAGTDAATAAGTADAVQEPPAGDDEPTTRTSRRHRTHTLLPGQTLEEVAALHGVGVEQVAELNGLDPELVFAGQVVRIPHA